MNIGEIIRSLRKQKRLPQYELARDAGITQAYLSQIEKNKKEPGLTTLKKLSEALKVPLAFLFLKVLSEDNPNDDLMNKTKEILELYENDLLDK